MRAIRVVPVNGILEHVKVVFAAVFAVPKIVIVGCGGVIVHPGNGKRLKVAASVQGL